MSKILYSLAHLEGGDHLQIKFHQQIILMLSNMDFKVDILIGPNFPKNSLNLSNHPTVITINQNLSSPHLELFEEPKYKLVIRNLMATGSLSQLEEGYIPSNTPIQYMSLHPEQTQSSPSTIKQWSFAKSFVNFILSNEHQSKTAKENKILYIIDQHTGIDTSLQDFLKNIWPKYCELQSGTILQIVINSNDAKPYAMAPNVEFVEYDTASQIYELYNTCSILLVLSDISIKQNLIYEAFYRETPILSPKKTDAIVPSLYQINQYNDVKSFIYITFRLLQDIQFRKLKAPLLQVIPCNTLEEELKSFLSPAIKTMLRQKPRRLFQKLRALIPF